MAVSHTIQLIGSTNSTSPEVESATKALRVTPKPDGSATVTPLGGGWYAAGFNVGLSVANTTNPTISAGSVGVACVWQSKVCAARIRSFTVCGSGGSVAGTAGIFTVDLRLIRLYQLTAINEFYIGGGNGPTPGGDIAPSRLRTGMPDWGWMSGALDSGPSQRSPWMQFNIGNMGVVANTSLLGAAPGGSETIAAATAPRIASAGTDFLPITKLWDTTDGDGFLELDKDVSLLACISGPAFGNDTSVRASLTGTIVYCEVPYQNAA